MPSAPLKVVACTYEMEPRLLIELLAQLGRASGTTFSGVVVDNGGHDGPSQLGAWRIQKGSNTLMDFSAYGEGAELIAPNLGLNEDVLFLNDTTFTRHNPSFHLKRLLGYREMTRQTNAPCIVGKTDSYTNICYANPWSGINVYVSSFAFLLNSGGVEEFIQVYQSLEEVMGSVDTDMNSDGWAPALDHQFREFLRMHLIRVGSPTAWYQARKYAGNMHVLQKKAHCVYLEHRLSGEIGRKGVIVAMYPRMRDKLLFSLAEKIRKITRTVSTRLSSSVDQSPR